MNISPVLASTIRCTYVREALALRDEGRINDCIRSLEVIAQATDKELLGNDLASLMHLKRIQMDVYVEMD